MEQAKKFYDMDEGSQVLKRNAEAALYDLLLTKQFDTLLEIGCGNGHFLHKFPGKTVLGIDINQEMLDLAVNLEGKISRINIVENKSFIENNRAQYDIITANYVFTELRKDPLLKAFINIYQLLADDGHFCFTISNPQTRHTKIFPGYKLDFKEEYAYEKNDLEFSVLLLAQNGKYVDVGIRDFHQPVELYDSLLKQAGFTVIKKEELSKGHDYSYALLYEVQK